MALPCARAWARRRRALAAALALALAATLSGCQSNPEPPPLERAATSPSPAPSPALAAPTLPPEARGTSEAAAKAFVRHYVAAVNYAMTTGDIEPLRTAGDARCRSCNAVMQRIESVYERGGFIDTDGWRIASIRAVPMQPRRHPTFDLGLVLSPQRVIEHRSARPKQFEGGRLPATLSLDWRGSAWVVANWERAA